MEGRNLRIIDYRWGEGSASKIRENAAELAALAAARKGIADALCTGEVLQPMARTSPAVASLEGLLTLMSYVKLRSRHSRMVKNFI